MKEHHRMAHAVWTASAARSGIRLEGIESWPRKKATYNNAFELDPAEAKRMVANLTPRERQTAERIAMA